MPDAWAVGRLGIYTALMLPFFGASPNSLDAPLRDLPLACSVANKTEAHAETPDSGFLVV